MPENQSPNTDNWSSELPGDLAAFTRQLTQFQPPPARTNREQLQFEAGRASALAEQSAMPHPLTENALALRLRLWKTVAMTMTAVSIGLTAMFLPGGRQPQVIINQQAVSAPVSQQPRPDKLPAIAMPGSPQRPISSAEPLLPPALPSTVTTHDGSLRFSRYTSRWSRELTLDDGIGLPVNLASAHPPASGSTALSATEPPLSLRSLMGKQAHRALDRLLKESPL